MSDLPHDVRPWTRGPLYGFMTADHARLEEALERATLPSTIHQPAYEALRNGLLRHLAMEERVLLPAVRRRSQGTPLPLARQLRLDHAALAALLAPSPTLALLGQVRSLLLRHDLLEEGPGGLYEACDLLCADQASALLLELRAFPAVPALPHADGPEAYALIERSLLAARAGRERHVLPVAHLADG